MNAPDMLALAEHHDEERKRYERQAARFGGDLGKNARSYAVHHAAEARALRLVLAEVEHIQESGGPSVDEAPRPPVDRTRG